MNKLVIRETASTDIEQVLGLYPVAFPEEELRPIVTALLETEREVLSLAAFDGDVLVAHILFTRCATGNTERTGALLGPLGVVPSHQRQGLGHTIVRAGLERLERTGIRQVFVLGDPGYYHRFGFVTERRVLTPYLIPEEWADAWQSMPLAAGEPLTAGKLILPEPWMEPALWGP
ncbi:MAG: N-acetyltransferase [Stappiaceae bacterium]